MRLFLAIIITEVFAEWRKLHNIEMHLPTEIIVLIFLCFGVAIAQDIKELARK